MKKVLLTILVLFTSINCFATTTLQNRLGSSWTQSLHPKQDKNDIIMGYGGEDFRPKTIVMGKDIVV